VAEFNPSQLTRDFGDWSGEARACRSTCAVFDFSFMARVVISGRGAAQVLSSFQNRRIDDMDANRIRYGFRVDSANKVQADLTLWKHDDDRFDVMIGRHADLASLLAMNNGDIHFSDLSDATAVFAVQGPDALQALGSLTDVGQLALLDYFSFTSMDVTGIPCLIGRLGYTGERGFEIIAPSEDRVRLWLALAQKARPAGFAAIDSLRIEAGFMLFANDLVLGPTLSELGVDPTGVRAGDGDRFGFVCATAKTEHEPVLWRPNELNIAPPVGNEIVITSACYSQVAQAVLVLGFSRRDADPARPLVDRTGTFTEICRVSRPFFDPLKTRPRGSWSL